MERLILPVELVDPATGRTVVLVRIGAAGGSDRPSLFVSGGDIENVRNIQGGIVGDVNLDISAGGAGGPDDPRGWLGLQYDNGHGTTLYDGRKRELASFRGYDDPAKNVARFKAPVRFWKGAYVRRSDGSWRRL